MLNPQPHPPHVEIGEAVQRIRRERDAVVGANRPRQPVLAKGALEDGPGEHAVCRRHALTRQQKPRVVIGDREG